MAEERDERILTEDELGAFEGTASFSLIDKWMRGESIKLCVDELLKAQDKKTRETTAREIKVLSDKQFCEAEEEGHKLFKEGRVAVSNYYIGKAEGSRLLGILIEQKYLED